MIFGKKFYDFIIEYSFYATLFFVPIIWFPVNYELFEFNKIILTYILASIVFGAWLFKAIAEGKLYIKRTPLDLIILLFLAGNILATLFSIDWHMSVFGYYTRFNGGLLSTFVYIFLYYALVTHFDRKKAINLLLVGFTSSVVVAVYAILQHPNPLFRVADGSFRGIDAGYWDINAEVRAFSFLGQPNWLAAYLSMFFFIGLGFLLMAKNNIQKIALLSSLIILYLGFTFTLSRGGTVGFIAGILVFSFLLLFSFNKEGKRFSLSRFFKIPKLGRNWVWPTLLIIAILIVNYFFGNALVKRGVDVEVSVPGITQLEIEGKQTTQIRFLVWEGALNIFKNSPIVGSGVETFAISYYQERPEKHNTTGEWDFLYNKAHNEYLNYLSTTGIVGTIPYLLLIGLFIFLATRWVFIEKNSPYRFLIVGLVAAYVSYLVQNIFGFSVVIIAILFFIIPAFFFIFSSDQSKYRTLLSDKNFKFIKPSVPRNIANGSILILTVLLILLNVNAWVADYYFARGVNSSKGGDVYISYQTAVRLRPDEPLFISELAVTEASLASGVDDSEFGNKLEQDALTHIDQALAIGPNNLGTLRNKLRVYFELIDKDEKYIPLAITAAEKATFLAPTDAKLHYNLALFYLLEDSKNSIDKSNETILKVLEWRPQYAEARRQLAKNYIDQGEIKKAKAELNFLLENNPEDIRSLNILRAID